MGERQRWWCICNTGWKYCHPTYAGSSKRKHCPCMCFSTVIFMLCEIHTLTKVSWSCTEENNPKQDHERGKRLWHQSQQALGPLIISPKDGPYHVAQPLPNIPLLQSPYSPASRTSIATTPITKTAICVCQAELWSGRRAFMQPYSCEALGNGLEKCNGSWHPG